MLMLNQRTIENFRIESEDLEKARSTLAHNNMEWFDRLIRLPLEEELHNWVKRKFPTIASDASDITNDSFARLRKHLLRQEELDLKIGAQLLHIARLECQWTLPTEENLCKNLGLKRHEFKKLLRQLQAGDEQLIETVYLNHFQRCVQFLIHNCGSNYDNAYNCTMDALLEIRKDLIKERIFYGNLDYYFTKRAKGKLFKLRNRKSKQLPEVDIEGLDFEDEERIESEIAEAELRTTIAEAFKKLCDDCRGILRQYYYEEQSFKEIAESLKKSHAAIRKQATRCRDKLRKHLGEHFYERFSQYLS